MGPAIYGADVELRAAGGLERPALVTNRRTPTPPGQAGETPAVMALWAPCAMSRPRNMPSND